MLSNQQLVSLLRGRGEGCRAELCRVPAEEQLSVSSGPKTMLES